MYSVPGSIFLMGGPTWKTSTLCVGVLPNTLCSLKYFVGSLRNFLYSVPDSRKTAICGESGPMVSHSFRTWMPFARKSHLVSGILRRLLGKTSFAYWRRNRTRNLKSWDYDLFHDFTFPRACEEEGPIVLCIPPLV